MLEITAEDIACLDDKQLREVVSRLCEAEVLRRCLSPSSVTSGGNQNAADGGVDVRVALPPATVIEGFVPRPATGFQVKQQDMPARAIRLEMRPTGAIRPSIQELADQSGAYIIVSSQGSTADTALSDRKKAMEAAVADLANRDSLLLDFYDRTRIATWVRSHKGLIPWVRALVGRQIPGWQSYGPWACDPAEYLLDDKIRIHALNRATDQGLSATQGIRQLRNDLRQERHVVRLVGLSGVGKTRLVQALFDQRVSEASLDPSIAIYTNMVDKPDPQPTAMASNLVAAGTRAVLVIDDCPPNLHHRLSELCRQDGSNVSLITIEYDIREDEPQETDVYTLESSSPELIEKLLRRRYQNLSQVNANTIAKLSGGNSRIAIALAKNVGQNETIAGLRDDQLFQRLFYQRQAPGEPLYRIAQVCALVYSFQGDDQSENDPAELTRLGRLIRKTPQDIYDAVVELGRRELVQSRGVWRAVLPDAVANSLAATALQNIPYSQIQKHLMTDGSERMMLSFSRRLGYLPASNEATRIVRQWLEIGDLLGNVASLDDLGLAMFENVAPAAPADALGALERALSGPQADDAAKECKKYCNLLRLLAYDGALFERCIACLVRIVTVEDVMPQAHETELFLSLFQLRLSGTRSTIEQRIAVVGPLLASPEERQRTLGVLAMKALLEAMHSKSVRHYDFGARSRDFGYWPRNQDEVQHWFTLALQQVETVACAGGPVAAQARAALAEKFRGLWLLAGSTDELVRVCTAIGNDRFWPEGWLAIRQTLAFDGNGFEPARLLALNALETILRPADLVQRVRAVVFANMLQGVDLDDFREHGADDDDRATRVAKTEALALDLGKAVAIDEAVLRDLLPEIVSRDGQLQPFGQGLLVGAPDARAMWQRLMDALAATPEASRKPQVFCGFLKQLCVTDPALANAILDEAVEHELLAEWYPYLQAAVDLSAQDVRRLNLSAALGKAPAKMYTYVGYARATDPIPAPDLRELILAIARLPSGLDVALKLLHTRLNTSIDGHQSLGPELVDTGRTLMDQLAFTRGGHHQVHIRCDIAAACLTGEEGAEVVAALCRRLKNALAKYETRAYEHAYLLIKLFKVQPLAALDGLCAGDQEDLDLGLEVLRDGGTHKDPLSLVSDDNLLAWCDQIPLVRYPAMARVLTFMHRPVEHAPPAWTSRALRFLEKAPDPQAILRIFTSRFRPSSAWSGSLATILESKAPLLAQLQAYPELQEVVSDETQRVRRWIEEEQRRERLRDREQDERFE